MRRSVPAFLLAAVLLNALTPTNAAALKWLAWLDELSGPGEFDGVGFLAGDVVCIGAPLSPPETLALVAYTSAGLQVPVQASTWRAQATIFENVIRAIDSEVGATREERLEALLRDIEAAQKALRPYSQRTLLDAVLALRPERSAHRAALDELTNALDPSRAYDPGFWADYEENQRRFRRCRVDRSNNVVSIQLELSWLTDDRLKDETRYTGKTRITTMSAIAYVPVGRLLRWRWSQPVSPLGRSVEIGLGVGAYSVDGTTVRNIDMWRGVIPLRVRIIPSEIIYALKGCACSPVDALNVRLDPTRSGSRWRRFWQAFQYRYGWDMVIGTIDRTLYGELGPQTADERNEWVRSHGWVVDAGMLFRAAAGR